MTVYSAKVVVEYYFDFDTEDVGEMTEKEAEDYAYYHFNDYAYNSEVYSVEVEAELEEEEESEDE